MYDRQKRRPLFPDSAASQQGGAGSVGDRSLFSEDPVVQTAGNVVGEVGAPGVRGDPYQLYQTMVICLQEHPPLQLFAARFLRIVELMVSVVFFCNRTRMRHRGRL